MCAGKKAACAGKGGAGQEGMVLPTAGDGGSGQGDRGSFTLRGGGIDRAGARALGANTGDSHLPIAGISFLSGGGSSPHANNN